MQQYAIQFYSMYLNVTMKKITVLNFPPRDTSFVYNTRMQTFERKGMKQFVSYVLKIFCKRQ